MYSRCSNSGRIYILDNNKFYLQLRIEEEDNNFCLKISYGIQNDFLYDNKKYTSTIEIKIINDNIVLKAYGHIKKIKDKENNFYFGFKYDLNTNELQHSHMAGNDRKKLKVSNSALQFTMQNSHISEKEFKDIMFLNYDTHDDINLYMDIKKFYFYLFNEENKIEKKISFSQHLTSKIKKYFNI